jgi:hypothetical protein
MLGSDGGARGKKVFPQEKNYSGSGRKTYWDTVPVQSEMCALRIAQVAALITTIQKIRATKLVFFF